MGAGIKMSWVKRKCFKNDFESGGKMSLETMRPESCETGKYNIFHK